MRFVLTMSWLATVHEERTERNFYVIWYEGIYQSEWEYLILGQVLILNPLSPLKHHVFGEA
jgi:hypothetical protein